MNGGELIGLTSVVLIFGWPLALIIAGHHRRILELKLRLKQQADQSVLDELQDLKRQMTDLRDTTTRYDVSFDAALQRLDSRMSHLEQRVAHRERESEQAQSVRS